MKKRIVCLILFFLVNFCKSQNWQWVNFESQANSVFNGLCSDQFSNVYYSSYLNGNGIYSNSVIPQSTVTPYMTGVITKRDGSGSALWSVFSTNLYFLGLSCDPNGDLLALGCFTVPVTLANQSYTPSSNWSQVLLKFSSTGTLLWSIPISQNFQGGFSITKTDSQGNIYLGGWSISPIIAIGQSTIVNTATLTTTYANIVCKLNPSGNLIWYNMSNSQNLSQMADMCIDGFGNCIAVGVFYSQLAAGNSTLVSAGSGDAFAVKYDASGNQVWAVRMGGQNGDGAHGVSADPSGNIYITGSFSGNALFGNSALNCLYGDDAFFQKLNASGQTQWVRQIGSANSGEYGYNAQAYTNGAAVVVSVAGPSVSSGSSTHFFPINASGVLIAGYDANGNPTFSKSFDSYHNNWPLFCLDQRCGFYIGTTDFGPTVSFGSSSTYTHTYRATTLIARLDANINAPLLSISGTYSACIGSSVNLTASGAASYTWSNGNNGNSLSLPVNSNTLISVSGSSPGLTCPVTINKYITALPPPSLSLIASSTLICAGEQVSITASGALSYLWTSGSNNYSIAVSPTTNTVYQVTGSNINCQASNTVLIQLKPSPLLQISGLPTNICAGDQFTLNASGADTYTWNGNSPGPSFILASANNTVLTIAATITSSGCRASTAFQVMVSLCTGFEKLGHENFDWKLYPNPASQVLFVETNRTEEFEILNLLGEIVLQFDTSRDKTQLLYIQNYAAGIYFIRSRSDGKVRQFVKTE